MFLVNPHTGSVDTEENWKADYLNRDLEQENVTWEEWGRDLIEVEIVNGEWVEV